MTFKRGYKRNFVRGLGICPGAFVSVTLVGSLGTQPEKPLLASGEILLLCPTAEQSQILQKEVLNHELAISVALCSLADHR